MTRSAGGAADSAGVPWEGRRFEPNASAGDDGRADPRLAEALARFHEGEGGRSGVVEALRTARLLVPLLAEEGAGGPGAHGLRADHSQELALVEVAAPDGRRVLPAFSSVATLAAWNPDARPVPVEARRIALAAGGEGTELVVLDPGPSGGFALRRNAIRAIATDTGWTHPVDDPRVTEIIDHVAAALAGVLAARALDGDPHARLDGPEVVVAVVLRADLDAETRRRTLEDLATALAGESELAERVDSVALTVVS